MATVIVSAVLLAIVAAVIWKMVKDRKAGKGGCSCGCENCSRGCHKA